jgi:hypothetical protein
MPIGNITATWSGFDVGDVLTLAQSTLLLGIELASPTAAWPTAAESTSFDCPSGIGSLCFVNHDGDAYQGITLQVVRIGEELSPTGCGAGQPFVFRGIPLDAVSATIDNSVRAEELRTGARVATGAGGAVDNSCAAAVGEASAQSLALRSIDCRRDDNNACSAAEARVVDEWLPEYNILARGGVPPVNVDQTPSPGPRSALVRLGKPGVGFDCTDVRAAGFPAL